MNSASRQRGCLLGLACGDAVGTTVEFRERGSFAPVTDMTGGGPFRLPPSRCGVITSPLGQVAFQLDIIRALNERDAHATLSCTGMQRYALFRIVPPNLKRLR